MRNRHFSLVLVLMLVAAAFATATARAQSIPIIAAVKCDKPGKVSLWVWDEDWKAILEKSLAVYKQKYCPGAEVELVQQPYDNYWQQVKTSATGGDLPDVFNMSQDNFLFYVKNDALLDLQPYWDKAKIDTKVWGKGLVDPYRYGSKGDLYAGPVNWDTIALYYNKDLFDAAKVAYPTATWTWDDFASAAGKLTDKAKDQYGASVYAEYQGGYGNWIASAGETPIVDAAHTTCTLTSKTSIDTLKFLKGLQTQGVMPTTAIMGGSNADNAFSFFASGKVAMVTGGSWKLQAAAKLKFKWDVVQLPLNPVTKRSRAILHSVGYVVSAKSKAPDLAANLVVYLSSDEAQKFFAEAGGVAPANPSQELADIWKKSFKSDANIQAFVDATKDSQGVTPFGEIWDKMNTDLVVSIFDNNVPVEQVTKETCDFIDKQIAATK